MKGKMLFLLVGVVAVLLLSSIAYAQTRGSNNTSSSASRTVSPPRTGTSGNTWVACTDKDNGKSLTQASSGTGCNDNLDPKCGTFPDTCDEGLQNTAVIEVYCEDNSITWESYPCPAKSVCASGRCVACTDTDNGFNGKQMGYTGGVDKETGKAIQTSDYCADKNNVMEYFCGNDGYATKGKMSCSMGYECKNGACVATGGPTCASEGQACPSGVVCCAGTSCTKQSTGTSICKGSTAAKAVGASNSALGKKTLAVFDTAATVATDLPGDNVIGFANLADLRAISVGKEYGANKHYEVNLWTGPNDDDSMFGFLTESNAEGIINGVDDYYPLDSLKILFDDSSEAINFYDRAYALQKSKGIAVVTFASKDCNIIGGNAWCTVGNEDGETFSIYEEYD